MLAIGGACKLTFLGLGGATRLRGASGGFVVAQSALQPTALIARPVAMLITLPYAWVRAFYENAVILGAGSDAGLGELGGKARRIAALWPKAKYHHAVMAVFLRVCRG